MLCCIVAIVCAPASAAVRSEMHGSKTNERVKANDYDVYKLVFYGGEDAEVFVSGDGDTDLDLFIYDNNGNLIDSDTDYTDDCYASWHPIWTGTFLIKIVNHGNVYNNYTMWTN